MSIADYNQAKVDDAERVLVVRHLDAAQAAAIVSYIDSGEFEYACVRTIVNTDKLDTFNG
jgi:hypothetical protein